MLGGSNKTLRIMRSQLVALSSLRALDAKALVALLATLAVLCAYRFYSFWTTGFFVSDEFGYFFDAAHGAVYSDRWFFGWVNIFIFKALGITSVDAFSYLLPFYMFFWTAITLVVFHKLLRLLCFDEVISSLSLLSSFILISFVLLSLGFLTEPVGLSMAMVGVYCLARFLKSKGPIGLVWFSLLAACFFGFAAGTREPYNAFLIAGALIVAAIAVARRKESFRARRLGTRTLLFVAVFAFVVPAMFFLFVPTQAYTQQVAPISSSLIQSVASNPLTSGGAGAVVTSTVTATVTGTVTVNGTVTHTTTTTTTVTTSTSPYPFYKRFVLTNALLIFIGGIALGWGPICFAIGLAGFLILLRRTVRGRDLTTSFMLFTSVTALGSYFVVSFIYAPDPTYFSFQNYSTLIRFSDTALPAYFLLAPVVMALIAKSRRRMAGLAAVVIIFALVAVPVYQTYAISNLGYTTVSPFGLDYRSPAVQVRNYVNGHQTGSPFDVLGVPYGWYFTPGIGGLPGVHVYSATPEHTLSPALNYSAFLAQRWTEFYVYSSSNFIYEQSTSPYLLQFIPGAPVPPTTNQTTPFKIIDSTVVIRNPDWLLTKVDLSWTNSSP